ncbi:hypothetical protein ACFU5O_18755 [Streptomyces sp. NPDC057445]|uniref:hypothetical protein n=1 Tax=Streptomyces sp. NPDC057445 TaxID=3346136 RepID=UPI003688F814
MMRIRLTKAAAVAALVAGAVLTAPAFDAGEHTNPVAASVTGDMGWQVVQADMGWQ